MGTQAGRELSLLQNPSTAAAALSQLPGFQFQQQTGMWGVNNAATAGSGLGGNVLTAASNYNQGLAQNTWLPYMQSLQQTFGTGAGAAGGQASALSTGGTSIGQLYRPRWIDGWHLYGGAGPDGWRALYRGRCEYRAIAGRRGGQYRTNAGRGRAGDRWRGDGGDVGVYRMPQ